LARADAESRLPQLEHVKLNDWLPEHLRNWSGHERGKDMMVEGAAGGPYDVAVHPSLLGELLNILIDNACKYSPPGTPITIHLRADAKTACVEVEDRGCGIAA